MQNFMLISNLLKKFLKNAQTSYKENKLDKYEQIFVTFLLITFFVHFYTTFSTDLNRREILRFFLPFLITKKNCWVILVLFSNFEAKRAKNG
jgi:hypothetical protein